MATRKIVEQSNATIPDPPFAHTLFNSTEFAWLFLIVRLWLGYQWLEGSLYKISDPKWVAMGEALKGYWLNAVKIPETGKPPIASDWYRGFLQFMLDTGLYTWFAKLVAFGEMAIGVALISGAFVGIAAFFGAFMNWNFIMAGSASTNGLLLALAVLLILT